VTGQLLGPSSRRARRALLWAAILFLLVQLLAGVALDYYGMAVRFPTAAHLLAALDASQRKPNIVFLGSSRFGMGLSAPEISRIMCQQLPGSPSPEVFNASLEAGDPIWAKRFLRELQTRDIRPALALIEVSPETVNRYNMWTSYHVYRQLSWQDMPAFVFNAPDSRTLFKILEQRLVPLYMHRQAILQMIANSTSSTASPDGDQQDFDSRVGIWYRMLGLPARPPTISHPDWTITNVGLVQRWLRRYKIGGNAASSLEQLLAQCRQLRIQVILVGIPVTELQRRLYTAEIDAAFLAYMKRLCVAYQCQFVDYRAAVPDRYFSDNHHLHVEGCIYFSRKLAEEVVAPAWRLVHGDPEQPLVVSREES
jgi:hypothetical protein